MKTKIPVVISSDNSPSHLPMAGRFLQLLLTAYLLAGCVSTYEVPEYVTKTANIGGGAIFSADQKQLVAALFVNSVDEDPLPSPLKYNTSSLFRVEPGHRSLSFFRVRVLTDSKATDSDYLPPLEVALLPGKIYRLTGKVIVGSAIAYWIEEVESGARITEVHYDPVQWTEGLMEIEKQPPAPKAHATLDTHIDRHFTSKTYLLPGADCFSMVYESLVNGGSVALGALAAFAPGGGGSTGVPGDYGYNVYNPICIDVEAGHHYQVKLVYFDRKDGRPVHKTRRDFYQVWDLTDDRVVLDINRRELGMMLKYIE